MYVQQQSFIDTRVNRGLTSREHMHRKGQQMLPRKVGCSDLRTKLPTCVCDLCGASPLR